LVPTLIVRVAITQTFIKLLSYQYIVIMELMIHYR